MEMLAMQAKLFAVMRALKRSDHTRESARCAKPTMERGGNEKKKKEKKYQSACLGKQKLTFFSPLPHGYGYHVRLLTAGLHVPVMALKTLLVYINGGGKF